MRRLVMVFLVASMFIPAELLCAQDLPTAPPETVGMCPVRLARIGQVMDEYIARNEIAGSVTMIARHGTVVHLEAHGFRDVEAKDLMAVDDIFRICSMTKPITSVAVMMLYEEGKLLLNDPVSKYIPEFADPTVIVPQPAGSPQPYIIVPAKREITIRNLLTHTSGIPYSNPLLADRYKAAGISDGYSRPTPGTIGDMVRNLARQPLLFNPGEQWEYGLNSDVLGYLIEVVSGMPLDEFFLTRIFEPLGMKDTCFYLPDDKESRLATCYGSRIGKLIPQPLDPGFKVNRTYFSGGAGLRSTAEDYMKFCLMLLNGGVYNGVRLLSPVTVSLMTTNAIGDLYNVSRDSNGDKFGLGFSIRTDRGEYGGLESNGFYTWSGALYTHFWVDPEQDFIGIIMTQLNPHGQELKEKFRVLAYQAIVGE